MNQKIKSIIKASFIFSIYCWFRGFRSPLERIVFYWEGFRYYIFNHILTYFPNHLLRIFYLRRVLGVSIGKECFIHMGCFFAGNNTIIGNNTVIGRNCYLGSGGKGGRLIIKNNVSLTAQTYIFCATHLTKSPIFECVNREVTIEDYAWVGARAMILPGVRIGKGAVLGAASTATKDVPDYAVYAGSPAKEVGQREKELVYTLKYFPCFQ